MARISIPRSEAHNPKGYVTRTFAPELTAAALSLYRACYEHTALTLREFEGARMRVAEINGCALCQQWRSGSNAQAMLTRPDGSQAKSVLDNGPAPDESYYRNVANWREWAGYTERERLAIGYAEYLSLDPQGCARDDDFWGRMREAFLEAEIVDLSYCIYSWFQGRITHALGLDDACSLQHAMGPSLAFDEHPLNEAQR